MGQFNPQIILLYQTIYRVRDQGLSLDVLADIWVCKVFTDVLLSGHISQKLSEIPIFYVYNFSTWGCCSPSNYSGWIMQILICSFRKKFSIKLYTYSAGVHLLRTRNCDVQCLNRVTLVKLMPQAVRRPERSKF